MQRRKKEIAEREYAEMQDKKAFDEERTGMGENTVHIYGPLTRTPRNTTMTCWRR